MSKLLFRWVCALTVMMATYALVPTPTAASHTWSNYHWQRTSSAMRQIPIRRFHSAAWLPRYATAYADWRKAAMTKVRPIQGSTGGARNPCPFAAGQITSCDGSYGNTGWLGLASIFVGSGGHITQGTSKVNNTYFNKAAYNTVAFRQSVLCQEIGHNFGLGHVNEVFGNRNVGSCMDYTSRPQGGGTFGPSNEHPYAHDYALINSKHTHVGAGLPGLIPGFASEHSENEVEAEMPRAMAEYAPMQISQLGKLVGIGNGGRTERYEMDFGNGFKVAHFVIRAK
jgi:hypothetical protein